MYWGLAACAVLLGGCVVDVDNSGVTFACGEDLLCPEGKACVEGLCQGDATLDDAAPVDATSVKSIDAAISDATVADAGPVSDAWLLPADWWDESFTRRRRIYFDNSQQNEDLTNFPVLIVLDGARVDFANTQDLGQDLRFVDRNGALLPYEIERWNEANKSFVWVRLSQVSASSNLDYISMYYGNPYAAVGQTPQSVWHESYSAVWHMAEDPSVGASDSTTNLNHGTSTGEMGAANLVLGKVSQGVHFDGVNDWIQVPHSASLNLTGDSLTVSAWVRLAAEQPFDTGVVAKAEQAAAQDNYYLGVQSSEHANFRVQTLISGRRQVTHTVLATEQWHYLVGVYSSGQATLYVDNVAQQTTAFGSIVSTQSDLVIGRAALDEDGLFVGRIDEARVSSVARSENWLAAQYLSMTDAFVSFQPEERATP